MDSKFWKNKFQAARKSQKSQHKGLIILSDRNKNILSALNSAINVIKVQAELIENLQNEIIKPSNPNQPTKRTKHLQG